MPFILPRHDQLLRDQRHLPTKDRQSRILLRFREPIPRSWVAHFQLIHLTRPMFEAGESDFYEARVFQPHRVARKTCPMCGCPMEPQSPTVSKCRNRRCEIPDRGPTSQYEFHNGPMRGVIAVITLPDYVVERQPKTIGDLTFVVERVDRALLVLDRRYDNATLAGVRRACHEICEKHGWGLL